MNLVRATASIGGLTLVSRVLGMDRDMLMARFIGAGFASDAFLIAWRGKKVDAWPAAERRP